MNVSSNIKLWKLITHKLGEQETEALLEYINNSIDDKTTEAKTNFVTKADLESVKGSLELKIESSKNQIILWTIGTMIALVALVLSLAKYIL